MNRHDMECDACGNNTFVIILANGMYYVECDACGASFLTVAALGVTP